MWIFRMFLMLVLVVIVTGFAMLNSAQRVTVTLGTENLTYRDIPLVQLLFEAFVLGAVVWFFVSVGHELTLRRMMRKQKREIADLNSEIAGLRQISLEDIDDDDQPEG